MWWGGVDGTEVREALMETSTPPHLKGKSWELREAEAKAGGGQDSVFGVLLQEEGQAAGDRSEEALGRQEVCRGQSSSGCWVEGQAFLAVGFGKALSPPEPVSSMGGQEISSPLCWAEEQSK